MAVNDHWMYQGRQYHQWFGHGTAPKEARDTRPASAGLFDPQGAGQRVDYRVILDKSSDFRAAQLLGCGHTQEVAHLQST